MKLKLIEPFAAGHHQLVTRAAFRRAGLSMRSWYRALDNELELVHPGVARIVGSPPTREQRILAAVLAAGPEAIASHRSAASLFGIDRPESDPVDIILTDRSRQATLEGVVVHRPRDQVDLDAVLRHAIRTCKLVRWLCDLGAVDPAGVHPAVGHVVTNGWASPNAMAAAVRAHSRRGRRGVKQLREALDDWLVDGKFLDSDLERRMKRLIAKYRLPPVEYHPIICGYEIDFRVIGTPVVLECDGWEHHDKRRTNFERDRVRRAELTVAGYIVVHFTWTMLTRQPQWVATMIRGAVDQWGSRPT